MGVRRWASSRSRSSRTFSTSSSRAGGRTCQLQTRFCARRRARRDTRTRGRRREAGESVGERLRRGHRCLLGHQGPDPARRAPCTVRLANLAVSDTLTISPTLERHIAGLDFAAKVMQVEVVHGVNDLVRYLGGVPPLEGVRDRRGGRLRAVPDVLQGQAERPRVPEREARDYLVLTERRSLDTYNWIQRSNLFLIIWGSVFLVATLVFAIWSAVDPDDVSWVIPAITGGVNLIQLVTVFTLSRPGPPAQSDESHDVPNGSREPQPQDGAGTLPPDDSAHPPRCEPISRRARRHSRSQCSSELAAIEKADKVDYRALERLRIGPDVEGEKGGSDGGGDGRVADGGWETEPDGVPDDRRREPSTAVVVDGADQRSE